MNLTEYQIQAIVDTLEKQHKKFWADKDKLTPKPVVEKKDKDGLTSKERDFLIAKNKKIRAALEKLPIEAKIELQYDSSYFFKNYYSKGEKGLLEKEEDTLAELIDNYNAGKESKRDANWDKPKKEPARTFKRDDITRQVTLASIEAGSIAEILSKVKSRSLPKDKKSTPVKKSSKKK